MVINSVSTSIVWSVFGQAKEHTQEHMDETGTGMSFQENFGTPVWDRDAPEDPGILAISNI